MDLRYDGARERGLADALAPAETGLRACDGLGVWLQNVPEWRNWQTRGTQNPVRFTPSAGSTPASGTSPTWTYAIAQNRPIRRWNRIVAPGAALPAASSPPHLAATRLPFG